MHADLRVRGILEEAALPVFIVLLLVTPILWGCAGEREVLRGYKNARKLGIHKVGLSSSHGSDPVFNPYIEDFESRYGGPIGDIEVRFGEARTFAQCKIDIFGKKSIIVNRAQWYSLGRGQDVSGQYRILLFHEFAHCVLERLEHVEERIILPALQGQDNRQLEAPASIMAPILSSIDLTIILANEDIYMNELFGYAVVSDTLN